MESRVSPCSTSRRVAGVKPAWALLSVLGVLAIATLLFTSQAQAAPPRIEGATYVGSDTCKGCHEEAAKKMERTLHGKLLGTSLAKGEVQARGCEGCHGPGSKHLDDPANPANNFRFGKGSPLAAADKNSVCLQCHAKGKRMLWAGSPHESRDVTCVTCHSVHGPVSQKGQLKLVKADRFDSRAQSLDAVQYDLCGQCHQVKAMQFQRSSHMPMGARGEGGKIVCTSCHNPHGTVTEKLIAAVSVNENCTTCHADKRGPFLWEHAPVLENCLNCHQAHGSNNAPLLKVRAPRLCETCHAGGRHNAQTYPMNDRRAFNRSCVNCHFNIHGSNHPSGERFLR
jgi:DmsE family decaheme c-type cytochrome